MGGGFWSLVMVVNCFYIFYTEWKSNKRSNFPPKASFGFIWESVHPIEILLAGGYRYLPRGSALDVIMAEAYGGL